VVQRAGKEPFQDQVEKRVARPLQMKSLQTDVEFDGQLHWAAGYVKKDGQVVPAKEVAHDWKHGAGGFKSDVRDFAKWAQALLNHRLMSDAAEKAAWTVQNTSDGKPTKWGLGFMIDDQGGLKVSHNGEQDEATTRLVIYPKTKRGVVVMCNCEFGDVGAISTAVFKALSK
jgi:CubicO group peptidase (beta-lactamase class C family)